MPRVAKPAGQKDDGCFNEEEIKCIVEHSKSINIVICKGVQSVIGAITITTMDDFVAATTTTNICLWRGLVGTWDEGII